MSFKRPPSPAFETRQTARISRLSDAPPDYFAAATPAERVAAVWPLTQSAWTFLDPARTQLPMQRQIACLRRGKDARWLEAWKNT